MLLCAQQRSSVPADALPADFHQPRSRVGIPDAVLDRIRGERRWAEVGRFLFFDPILSIDQSVACASCHLPRQGFASEERFPTGVRGRRCKRHAPTLINRALGEAQMWDGRAQSLEEQVLMPIVNEDEMALPMEEALQRLRIDARYTARFQELSEDGVTQDSVARALAAFVRSIVAGDTAVDRFRNLDDRAAMETEALAGFWIYESKGGCWRCHVGPNFSDERFHNTGIGAKDGVSEDGRFAVTGKEEDRGRFKTPTLRGLAYTAPYMHDGSIATLPEVVELYRKGANPNSHLDPELKPLDLSDDDVRYLVAFLEALSKGNLEEICR